PRVELYRDRIRRFCFPQARLCARVLSAPFMSFIGRQDRMLLTGFAVALIVVFSRQIRWLLDLAREVEQQSGLALMPALIILIVLFMFHQQGKRQESRTRAAAAEAEAR